MGEFDEFFQTASAAKDARLKEDEERARKIARDAAARIDKISAHFRSIFDRVRGDAEVDLANQQIAMEHDKDISMSDRQGFIYSTFFRIGKKNSHGGFTRSEVHGFGIRENNEIEGFANVLKKGRFERKNIFKGFTESVTEEDVKSVIRSAIADLVEKLQ